MSGHKIWRWPLLVKDCTALRLPPPGFIKEQQGQGMPSSRSMLAQPAVAGTCKYFHPRRLAGEQMSLRPKHSWNVPACTMHLMTAAVLKNRMLTACSNLVLMNPDLPEDLPLHQSHGTGLGLLGLQRDHSPKGSCSSLLSCAAALRKTLGALPAWKEGLSPLLTRQGAAQPLSITNLPSHLGPAGGTHPSSWEGHPSCQKSCFRAFFLAHCRWVLH